MAEYLGLQAVGWEGMIKNWYNVVLAGLIIACVSVGSIWMLYLLYKKLRKVWNARHNISKVPVSIIRYFEDLQANSQRIVAARDKSKNPESFGAFLGSFSNPATPEQSHLLTRWDIMVLDPLQQGVLDAVAAHCISHHILGRIDVAMIVKSEAGAPGGELIQSLDMVIKTIATSFKRPQDLLSSFTGILLAEWETHFPPVIFNELVKYLVSLGLDVYLEVNPPTFLTESQCRDLNMGLICGIACTNGSILANGDRRDYYQMTDMMPAMRALAARSHRPDPIVMIWDVIDDHVELEHAMAKRSYTWCRYNSAINWIGSRAALTDAKVAVKKTLTGEPLGAMMWLKGEEIMKLHDVWRFNDSIVQDQVGDHTIYKALKQFIPDLKSKLSLGPPSDKYRAETAATMRDSLILPTRKQDSELNPFSFSRLGYDYTGQGCFQIGMECSSKDYSDVLNTQRRLRKQGLLKPVPSEELRKIGAKLHTLYHADEAGVTNPDEYRAIQQLINLLTTNNGDEGDRLRVYTGLHAGFRNGSDAQFWALYDVDTSSGVMDIYTSLRTKDLTGTILHTFMSSRGCTRAQCFMAEITLAELTETLDETWELPARLVQDIEQLTPTENLLFLRRLALASNSDCFVLAEKTRDCCEYQLLEVPTLKQLRKLNSEDYLRGEITPEDLIASRLAWYRQNGCQHPDPAAALSLFTEIDARLPALLISQDDKLLSQFEVVLRAVIRKNQIDASADFFAMSLYCAFRKLAFNEVYLEVLDRNPLPNPHSDQAACFAEMFALGSRCDSYFDTTPTVLGKILAIRQREYYKANQPPMPDDTSTELPTSYSSKQIELDPNAAREEPPFYYQITFLGMFAVPALIDILLLTTLGRGLYVTAYMSAHETSSATTALMVALFLCGAIGTWISAGGSYYLHSMAFSAMNMFVLTRFVAGLAICFGGGMLALVIIGVQRGFYAGLIFFLYFILLTTYLLTLSALSIYQIPGFMFQSGRIVIMTCLPILLISPIITMFIHHDVLVYLCVLTGFVTSLLVGARRVMSKWSTWYLTIPLVSDHEIAAWYETTGSALAELYREDNGPLPLPRIILHNEILKERNRKPWAQPTTDKLVLKLAEGYPSTIFLMDWYCRYSRTKMPFAFSATWNLQCKAAIDTLRDMQKGLKLHNAFLHWRHAGDEVTCGVLYFVIALMDKWVAILSGGSIVGLSDANSTTHRLAVGFGLAYYLIGAVCLDAVSQPLWTTANKSTPAPISSLESLRQVMINDAAAKRRLYRRSGVKLFFMHMWGSSITATLMWAFESSSDATIMYIAYTCAYTGLLWYQYNKVFTGPLAFRSLVIAAICGVTTGLVLHRVVPRFSLNNVIALATATWTSAFLSLLSSKILPQRQKGSKKKEIVHEVPVYHASTGLGSSSMIPQEELAQIFNTIRALPAETRHELDALTHPGLEVMDILMSRDNPRKSRLMQAAFRSAEDLVRQTADMWKAGDTVVEIIPANQLLQRDEELRSICSNNGERLHVYIILSLSNVGDEQVIDIRRNCKVIAEAIIQATAVAKLGLSPDHAVLAELLAVSDLGNGLQLPEGIKRQLESSTPERLKVIRNGDKALLKYFLLGYDGDIDWDVLPRDMRAILMKRCCAEPCHVTDEQLEVVAARFCKDDCYDPEEYVGRCNLGATLTFLVNSFAAAMEAGRTSQGHAEPLSDSWEKSVMPLLPSVKPPAERGAVKSILYFLWRIYNVVGIWIKLLVCSLVADPEFQRELDFILVGTPAIFKFPITLLLNSIWIYCKTLQDIILPVFLFHGRKKVTTLYSNMMGVKTVIEKNRIVMESLSGPSTGFFSTLPDGTAQFHQYTGAHEKKPEDNSKLVAVNTYSEKLNLLRKEEFAHGAIVNVFTFTYPNDSKGDHSRIPLERQCIMGKLDGQVVQYDRKGYIVSGTTVKDENNVEFQFWYRKNAKFEDELLRAEYVLPHMSIEISWSVPPARNRDKLDKWIPHSKVMEATFRHETEVYNTRWTYDHKFHPVIVTTLNGAEVATPPLVTNDWFDVLKKPKNCSFLSDNPLMSFDTATPGFFARLLGLNIRRYRISTSRARTHLWKSWKSGKEFDAVTARWLDEISLRSDRLLKPYWKARDWGRLNTAESYLHAQADTIMARVDIDPDVSSWTPIAFKMSDLYSFGQGGDARINTRTQSSQINDTEDKLHVFAMDTGTWPNEGGGVSACRRDMVNNLQSIKWHILAESANDFGVPKFQIEQNVQSLTVLPLWGLDFLTPTHGIFENYLDSAVQQKAYQTWESDIIDNFMPILKTLVRCSRAIELNRSHIEDASKALIALNNYFVSSAHWSDVWQSDIVKEMWYELWLTEDMENTLPASEWLEAERPTIQHMNNALDMWHRYLFVFSIPVPERIPDIIQASHHFAGASYAVLCKLKRNTTLHVWDHCISWREVTVFLSSAMSFDSPFVRTSLISLSRLASVLILHYADVVLPCADFFNPGWEEEIGTLEGTIGHRRAFARKIDPVVNGITDMERFTPIEKIKSELPTVTMLSHVRFVKDIKTAILAADMIVNDWGITDYRLHIYGDMEKAPTYSVECQEIIASKGLRDHVILKGLGSPSKVLEHAWMFLNSSVSEGLPLAMGEAALTGVPVVCTDVGASFRVVTDPVTWKRFSAVVAPNDALSLARAQISVLALLEEWSEFADDPPGFHPKLPLHPTKEEAQAIMKRMYEKSDHRRRLGMMGRNNVLNSFSSERYLREHEQMLWIGKYQSPVFRNSPVLPTSYSNSYTLKGSDL